MTNYAKENELWKEGDRILIAVSGGPDSLALLLALHEIAAREKLTLGCCCVNHHLRSNAAMEANFVRRVCKDLSVDFFLKDIDVLGKIKTGGSVETAARELRYEALREVKTAEKYDKIAVAHHGNDQVETILYHLIKGSGTKGLAGMKAKNEDIIRPLLGIEKQDILEFLKKYPYRACHDETNDIPDVMRNKIRLRLIPLLKEYNPKIENSILRMGSIVREEDDFLSTEAKKFISENVSVKEERYFFTIKSFSLLPLALKRRVLREVCARVSHKIPDFEGIEKFISLIEKGYTGNKSSASGNLMILEYGKVIIQRGNTRYIIDKDKRKKTIDFKSVSLSAADIINDMSEEDEKWMIKTEIYGEPPKKIFKNQLLLDADRVGHIIVRSKEEGDLFFPKGMKGSKKLARVMQDLHIPAAKRRTWPILSDEEHIYWIAFLRGSRFGNPDETTKKYLLITLEREIQGNGEFE